MTRPVILLLMALAPFPPADALGQRPAASPQAVPAPTPAAAPSPATAALPKKVLVCVPDGRVSMEPDPASVVVAAPPVGSLLDVVAARGEWLQIKLPKDSSGFERFGYILAGSTKPADASITAAAPVPRAARPAVGVLDFDYATVKQEWAGLNLNGKSNAPALMDVVDVGRGIADLLVDELLQLGEVRLLDRRHLQDVIQEQDLASGNRADPSATEVAQLRKILGAKYFVTGSVTKFGTEDNRVSGSALGLKGFAGFLAGFGQEKHTARVGLTVRVIDSSTGEILASAKAEGQSKRKGLLLGGMGGGFSGGGGGFSIGSSNFQETILGEATALAVRDAAAKLCAAMKELAAETGR